MQSGLRLPKCPVTGGTVAGAPDSWKPRLTEAPAAVSRQRAKTFAQLLSGHPAPVIPGNPSQPGGLTTSHNRPRLRRRNSSPVGIETTPQRHFLSTVALRPWSLHALILAHARRRKYGSMPITANAPLANTTIKGGSLTEHIPYFVHGLSLLHR